MPGAFKSDHMQLIEPILCWKIFNFLAFILGGQFLCDPSINYRGTSRFCDNTGRNLRSFRCDQTYPTVTVGCQKASSANVPIGSVVRLRKVRGTYTVEKSHRWRHQLNTCGKIENACYCAIYWDYKTIRTQATAATQRACSLSYQRGLTV